MDTVRILVVDDDEVARKNLVRLLSKEHYQVSTARNGASALKLLAEKGYDLVLTDLVMEEMDGLEVLARAKDCCPDIEIIVVTGHASIASAIEATKRGAYHYLEKPFRSDEVKHLIRRAIERQRLRRQVRELELHGREHPAGPIVIGQSRKMLDVVRLLKQVAPAECNVLLTGESGTGKELAASLIHFHSRRADRRFLAINCGGFSEELLANELFGHEKDAFTGATSARPGLLESASGGTLMLDEVGDMPLTMQIKLLRAIQEQEVIRVGGNQPLPIDVRIIAATNQDLKKAVSAGLFRQDLYYRLNVVSIAMPPLRERKEDVLPLGIFFLRRAANKSLRQMNGFSDEAMQLLTNYDFPGNVRELENIVERAVAIAKEDVVQRWDLPPDLAELEVFSFGQPDADVKTLRAIQSEYIQWVLERVGRNKTKAAKLLGIDRASLWRHLKSREIQD